MDDEYCAWSTGLWSPDDPAGQLEAIKSLWKNPDYRITATRLMIEASPGVDESSAVEELLAAHAEMESLTIALADARERRRAAARRLLELGRGFPWIAAQLGVTPQAVDGFVKYKDRNQRT